MVPRRSLKRLLISGNVTVGTWYTFLTDLSWESPETDTGSDGLNKLRQSVASWLRGNDKLPDLANALRLQRIVHKIDRAYDVETRESGRQ